MVGKKRSGAHWRWERCPKCKGSTVVGKNRCDKCGGAGGYNRCSDCTAQVINNECNCPASHDD